MNCEQLKQIATDAVNILYEEDRDLIRRNVHEVTIAHRLAVYLEQELDAISSNEKYHVDIEYNKDMENPKRLVPGEDGKRPDIIIHRRNSNEHNQLIIELKKNKGVQPDDNDDRKLKGATNQDYTFGYTLGLYLNLRNNKPEYTWYTEGRQTKEVSR